MVEDETAAVEVKNEGEFCRWWRVWDVEADGGFCGGV